MSNSSTSFATWLISLLSKLGVNKGGSAADWNGEKSLSLASDEVRPFDGCHAESELAFDDDRSEENEVRANKSSFVDKADGVFLCSLWRLLDLVPNSSALLSLCRCFDDFLLFVDWSNSSNPVRCRRDAEGNVFVTESIESKLWLPYSIKKYIYVYNLSDDNGP